MAMLAEELLLAMGFHLPTREREVVAAMETLGEPPLIVNRRLARTAMINKLMDFVKNEAAERGDHEMIKALEAHEGGSAWGIEFQGGHCFVRNYSKPKDDPEHLIETKLNLREMRESVPKDLQQYLVKGTDDLAQYESAVFLRSILSTGGIYRLDGGENGTQGVLDSIWGGLPFTELPKLPYPRMWFEARDQHGQPCPLWRGNPPEDAWNRVDCGELWGIAISEISPGTAWAVVAVRHSGWFYETHIELQKKGDEYERVDSDSGLMFDSHRYERLDREMIQYLPPDQSHLWIKDEEDRRRYDSESAYRGAMMGWAVTLVDIVTARNIDLRETFLPSRAVKQLTRAAPLKKFFSRVYDVSISTSSSDAKDETGNYLTVRFMVRGHWRISDSERAEWVEAKEAHCIWIRAHIKGPPGAPWKGRPVYVEPKKKG